MKKILIVDDDADYVKAVKLLLDKKYKVAWSNNTKKAAVRLKKEIPDLIVLDVMMDTMDEGFQFSYKLRADKKTKNIPILMSTGVSQATGIKFHPDKDNKDQEWIPVDRFLDKPLKSAQFLKAVKDLLHE